MGRQYWAWSGLTCLLATTVALYMRTLGGFAHERMNNHVAFWIGATLAWFAVEIIVQARRLRLDRAGENNPWRRELSDDTSRAKLFYVLGIIVLYMLCVHIALNVVFWPAGAGDILPKAGFGIIMAHSLLAASRKRPNTSS